MITRFLLMAAVASLATGSAQAQSAESLQRERDRLSAVTTELKTLEERRAQLREESRKIAAEISATTRQMIRIAAQIQATEDQLSRADRRLVSLATDLEAKRTLLAERQRDVLALVGVLQTLSRQPPELLLVKPSSAIDTARTASLLSGLLPTLRARTGELRKTIGQLQAIRQETQNQRRQQQAGLMALAQDQSRLAALAMARADQRQGMLAEVEEDQARIGDLADQARDIQDLLARLEAEERLRVRLAGLPGPRPRPALDVEPARPSPTAVALAPPPESKPATRSFAQSRGDLLLPVRGDLVQSFGDQTSTGSARGILIRARPEAQIVAPYGGRVAFAGLFRGYGMLLIISHGQGYHSLIAGMARIDGKVGDQVQAGEPVGVMGPGGSDLYLELRQGGQPINPLPWLTAGLRKTQG
jgi:murein hydrolase activator